MLFQGLNDNKSIKQYNVYKCFFLNTGSQHKCAWQKGCCRPTVLQGRPTLRGIRCCAVD